MSSNELTVIAMLASAYLRGAQVHKACTLFSMLDAVQPDQPKVLLGLAWSQLRMGEAAQALQTVQRFFMAGGVDAAVHLLESEAMLRCARQQEAALSMRRYVASSPDLSWELSE